MASPDELVRAGQRRVFAGRQIAVQRGFNSVLPFGQADCIARPPEWGALRNVFARRR